MNSREQLQALVERLERMPAIERARLAADLVDQHRHATQVLAGVRAAAVREAYEVDLLTLHEIGEALGISPGRAHQLLHWKEAS